MAAAAGTPRATESPTPPTSGETVALHLLPKEDPALVQPTQSPSRDGGGGVRIGATLTRLGEGSLYIYIFAEAVMTKYRYWRKQLGGDWPPASTVVRTVEEGLKYTSGEFYPTACIILIWLFSLSRRQRDAAVGMECIAVSSHSRFLSFNPRFSLCTKIQTPLKIFLGRFYEAGYIKPGILRPGDLKPEILRLGNLRPEILRHRQRGNFTCFVKTSLRPLHQARISLSQPLPSYTARTQKCRMGSTYSTITSSGGTEHP